MGVCPLVHGDSERASSSTGHRSGSDRTIPQRPPAGTIVIGLGSEIAGDDGVGIVAARRLGERLRELSDVDVIELPWAGLHLLTALRGYRRAILIDSLRSGRYRPGTVVRLCEHDLAGSVRLNSFHDLNYPTAMALGRVLGWPMPAEVEVFAVEGQSFDRFASRLTPAVQRGLHEVVRLVISHLTARCDPGYPSEAEGKPCLPSLAW